MTCGIYLLSFKETPKLYVGQSNNIEERFKQHIRQLKAGTHVKKLQQAFYQFGLPELEILEICSPVNLDSRELYYINFWNSIEDGYNSMTHAAGGCSIGEDNSKSLYSNEEIIHLIKTIVQYKNMQLIEISEMLDMQYSTVKNVANGNTYRWLESIYPDIYSNMIALKGTRNNRGESQGNSKFSNAQIEETFKVLCANPLLSNAKIAEITGVTESVVVSITSKQNYQWIRDKYPHEFAELLGALKSKREYSRSAKARGISYPPIVSPLDASIHIVENVSKFAREHGLDTGQLNKVLNKKANSTKGWRLQ